MPVRNITSVVFGGEKLDEIYVTSMARVKHPAVHGRFAKEAKPQYLAGSLFRITGLGIRGVPEPRFAGWSSTGAEGKTQAQGPVSQRAPRRKRYQRLRPQCADAR